MGASTNRKLDGISALDSNKAILKKINILFIALLRIGKKRKKKKRYLKS